MKNDIMKNVFLFILLLCNVSIYSQTNSCVGTASILCPTSMSLEPNNPIVIKESELPEPLKIIKRWNMQLQEVNEDYEGIQVVMYEDGTRDKIIKIK